VPVDFFLFPPLKKELAGMTITRTEFKTKWEGLITNLTKDDFTRLP
jgi:hypothetical protein